MLLKDYYLRNNKDEITVKSEIVGNSFVYTSITTNNTPQI
jgi:hypothetical protein